MIDDPKILNLFAFQIFRSVAFLCLVLHLLKPAFLVLLTHMYARGVLSPFRALSI